MPFADDAVDRLFRARRTGLAFMITAGLVLLVLLVVLVVRQRVPVTAADSVPNYQPLPSAYQPPRVAWVGDSYTGGTDVGGRGDRNYSAIVSRDMRWRDVNVAQGGTGYVAGGRRYSFGSDDRLARLAQGGRYDLIFVVNGFNDYKYPSSDIYAGARRTYLRLKQVLSPGGRVVAVGYFPLRTDSAFVTDLNGDLARAAHDAGALFVDPSGAGWLTGQNYDTYIGTDTYHPSDLGHQFLAQRLEERFKDLGLNQVEFERAPSYGPLPGITPLPVPTPSVTP